MKRTNQNLGDICKFIYGKSLPVTSRRTGVVEVYGSNGIVGVHDEPLTPGETLIIGRKGSVGKITWSNKACFPIDTTYYIDASSTDQNLRWLFWYLKFLKLESLNKAAAVPGLNREDAYRLKIFVPPLAEQRCIAEQLDTADRILRLREQAKAKLDQLAQSMYEELTLKSHTETINLQELCEVRTGFAFKSSDYCDDGDAHIVRISDIQNGVVHVENTVRMLKKNVGKGERYKLHNNEILIAMSGATTGKVGLLEDVGDKFVYLNQRVGQFIIRDERKITREFLVAILNSRTYQKHILLTAAGAAQANISPKQLVDFNVRLPPIDELTTFSTKLDSSKKISRKISSFCKIAAALMASLQQQSFAVN